MTLSRRAVVFGLAGTGVVGAAAAVGIPAIGREGSHVERRIAGSRAQRGVGDRLVSGSFVSAACLGRTVRWTVAYPSAVDTELPVAIVLHGRGDDHTTVFGSHGWGRYLTAAVAGGTPPFAVAAVDGGDHSYWHRRSDGDNPQRMVLDEFIPMLTRRGLRTARVGLAGWSMGGYGALLLAERVGRRRCAVVAVDSPALWTSPGTTAPGAFDDEADYWRNDVFSQRSRLAGIPTRIAIGIADPFYPATRTFAAGLPTKAVTEFVPGGHDVTFWQHTAPRQIRFLGRHLRGL